MRKVNNSVVLLTHCVCKAVHRHLQGPARSHPVWDIHKDFKLTKLLQFSNNKKIAKGFLSSLTSCV